MRYNLHRILLAALVFACGFAPAQMHKVAKPEQVVRAVGVYEYTGELNKPAASRLIPVSLFIDGRFEDAGIYIARPVPFALLSGNVYELDSAGTPKALLDLAYARRLVATGATGDLAYDDGWFGYGKVQPLAPPRRSPLKASKSLPALSSSVQDTAATADPDRPVMIRRNGTNTSGSTSSGTTAGSPPADDPDRPTMKRRDGSGSSAGSTPTTAGTDAPPEDPDRPTMKRTSPSTDNSGSTSSTPAPGASSTSSGARPDSTAGTGDPANDPDRPTLKRRTPEEARKARNANAGDSAIGYDSLNDDPNRPNLHHGKPSQALAETDLPKLTGLPQYLHQMVAVSDAVDRNPHSFSLPWEDATQRAAILEKMQTLARARLAAYGKPASSTKPATVKGTASASARSPTHHAAKPSTQPLVPLQDEDLQAYLLSYGGDPTYIYSAHTDGVGAALRYVALVAQSDSLGQFKVAIENVTDSAHLDDTPRMRLIDAVDADASNRSSLLFELRGQTARQFALYRVIAGHSDQTFLTGTTQ